jgi:hypothetical protein
MPMQASFTFSPALRLDLACVKREGMDAAAVTSAVSFRNLRRESLFNFI